MHEDFKAGDRVVFISAPDVDGISLNLAQLMIGQEAVIVSKYGSFGSSYAVEMVDPGMHQVIHDCKPDMRFLEERIKKVI